MIFSLTIISAITQILDGNGTLTFKSQLIKDSVIIITTLCLNSTLQLNSLYGASFVNNYWYSSFTYFFWGWGSKFATSQNNLFFTPLWYQLKWTSLLSLLFLTPFLPVFIAAIKYLVLNCGCCYECKMRCKMCKSGCCLDCCEKVVDKKPTK